MIKSRKKIMKTYRTDCEKDNYVSICEISLENGIINHKGNIMKQA